MKFYIQIITALLGLNFGFLCHAQTPDSVYFYLNEDTVWFHKHPYIHSFVLENGQPYTQTLPFSIVEQQVYTADSINYVFLDTTASSTQVDSVLQYITQDSSYRGTFEVITSTLATSHLPFIRTRNTLEVVFKDSNITPQAVQQFASDYNLKLTHSPSPSLPTGGKYVYLFQTLGTENTAFESAIDKAVAIWENSTEVELVHPDIGILQPHSVPNDSLYGMQWAFNNTGSNSTCYGGAGTTNADANIAEAQNKDNDFGYGASYTGQGIDIGVIDFDNFEWHHQDLKGQFKEGYNTISGDTIRSNAYFSFAGAHGTWVSGIIGAKADNNLGIAGVAHGAKMRPMLIAAQGFDSYFTIALQKCLDWKVKIVNMSLGAYVLDKSHAMGLGSYQMIKSNSRYGRSGKGTILIASVGNEGLSRPVYPACFDEVLSVGASTPADRVKAYNDAFAPATDWASNTPNYLDVVAPGSCVWGTDFMGKHGYNPSTTFHYYQSDGTSAAAPIVSGLAALLLERDSTFTQGQIYQAIRNGTDRIGGYNYNADAQRPGWSKEAGYGRVNGYKIVHQTPLNINWSVQHVPASINNPIKEHLSIRFAEMEQYQLQLYDGTGRMIQQTQTTTVETFHWSTGQLSTGSYVLVITGPNNKVSRYKVIKQ